MFKSYFSDIKGNISVMFAVAFSTLILVAGGTIDIAHVQSHKSTLQAIADSSALAASKGDTVAEMRDLGKASLAAHKDMVGGNWKIIDVDIDPQNVGGTKNVKVKLTGEYQTAFLGIFGKKNLRIKTYSEVGEEKGDVEISLVLDISWSMSGPKVANLRTSAKDFIEVVMGEDSTSTNTSMNILPFGGNVNVGNPIATRLMAVESAFWDPSDSEYGETANSADDKADALYRFTGGMNCVETKQIDYDTNKIPDNSRSQLPRFMNQQSLLTICPEDESDILYSANNKQVLKNKIDELVLSHGTAMDVGALWGLKSLSPSYRGIIGGDFPNRPADFSSTSQKILIIMTDGNITGQGRPRKPNDPERLTDPAAMRNQQLYIPGNINSSSINDTASGRFKEVCDQAAANNIMVYTIGFRITSGDSADQLLDYCATDSSKYFFVESLDPSVAFEAIAASISQLRIMQ